MPDDLRDFQPLDPGRILEEDSLELKYWCKELRCTEAKLRDAISKVGNHVAAVREHLASGSDRQIRPHPAPPPSGPRRVARAPTSRGRSLNEEHSAGMSSARSQWRVVDATHPRCVARVHHEVSEQRIGPDADTSAFVGPRHGCAREAVGPSHEVRVAEYPAASSRPTSARHEIPVPIRRPARLRPEARGRPSRRHQFAGTRSTASSMAVPTVR